MKSFLLILFLALGVRAAAQNVIGLPIYTNGALAFTNFFATNAIYNPPQVRIGGLVTGARDLAQLQDTNWYPLSYRQAGQLGILTNLTTYQLAPDLTTWSLVYLPNAPTTTATAAQFVAGQQSMYPRPVMVFNSTIKAAIDAKDINIAFVGDSITAGASTPYPAGWVQNLQQMLRAGLPGFKINCFNFGLGSRYWAQFNDPNYKSPGDFYFDPSIGFERSEYWPGGTPNAGWSWQQYASNSLPDMIVSSFQMNEAGFEQSMVANISQFSIIMNSWPKVPWIVLGSVQNSTTDAILWPYASQNGQLDLGDMIRQASIRNHWGLIDQNKWFNMARFGSRTPEMPLTWEYGFRYLGTPGYWTTNGSGSVTMNGTTGVTLSSAQLYRNSNARDVDLNGTIILKDTGAIAAIAYRQRFATNRTGGYSVQIGYQDATHLYADLYYTTSQIAHAVVPVLDALGTNNFRIRAYAQTHETWLNGTRVIQLEDNNGFLTAGFSLGSANGFPVAYTNAQLNFYGQTNYFEFYNEFDLLGSTNSNFPTDPNASGGGGINHLSTLGNYRVSIPAAAEFAQDFIRAVGSYQNSVGRIGSQSMSGPLNVTGGSVNANSVPSFFNQNGTMSISKFYTNSIAALDLKTAITNAFELDGSPATNDFTWRIQNAPNNTFSIYGYLRGQLMMIPFQASTNGTLFIGSSFPVSPYSQPVTEVDFRQANVYIGDPSGFYSGTAFLNFVRPFNSLAGIQWKTYDPSISGLSTNLWRLQSGNVPQDQLDLYYYTAAGQFSHPFSIATNGAISFLHFNNYAGGTFTAPFQGTTATITNINSSLVIANEVRTPLLNGNNAALTYGDGNGSPAFSLKKFTAATSTWKDQDANLWVWQWEFDATQRKSLRGYSNGVQITVPILITTNNNIRLAAGSGDTLTIGGKTTVGTAGTPIGAIRISTPQTLVAGTVTVAEPFTLAGTRFQWARQTPGGTLGSGGLKVVANAGVGYTVTAIDTSLATQTGETSTVIIWQYDP